MKSKVIQGNNIDVLRTYPDNHFDSIVTDPPYGLDFLGKEWDANTGALETYQECLRVLKPGGHILAFSAARTYHHLAVTIEQAGFEIRDQLMWIYSKGFPKSRTVGNGWGTSLKPAHEPIVMARKPTTLSIIKNMAVYNVGGINIEGSRILGSQGQKNGKPIDGLFPSNVLGEILDYQKFFYCPKVSREERHLGFDTSKVPTTEGGMWDTDGSGVQYNITKGIISKTQMLTEMGGHFVDADGNKTDNGKFYVTPQTNKLPVNNIEGEYAIWCQANNKPIPDLGNTHPTVKPIELMKYLIKLVTPPGGHVLDPFNGSGSTGCAAVELDYEYTGIELDPKYVEIANKRIQAWYEHTHTNTFVNIFEEE